MKETAVEFKEVVKTYGKGKGKGAQTAVDHVSFTIDKGEFVVILGQSGAGKSTVLNMLGGMDVPTGGKPKSAKFTLRMNVKSIDITSLNSIVIRLYKFTHWVNFSSTFKLPKYDVISRIFTINPHLSFAD